MNAHPYLRAYMAGITVPTMALLLALTVFCIARLGYHVPVPIERLLVFPMAIVPNLFGLWNILYVRVGSGRRLPIGLHGALLPFLVVPLAFTIASSLGFLTFGQEALVLFDALRIPYSRLAVIFPGTVVIYYLVWKHLVGFFNELLGIA